MAPKLKIVEARHEIFVGRREIKLARMEWLTLIALRKTNRTMSRDEIVRDIYGQNEWNPNSRIVDAHVSRLRRKIKLPVVATVSTFGYKYIGK